MAGPSDTSARTDPPARTPTDGPDGPGPEPGGVTDGRLLRRQRNRDAVVDALLELFRAGNLHPSTEEVANRSGLSPRSVFRYFDDVDDLTQTAIARFEDQAVALLPVAAGPDDAPGVKALALAEQRFRLFDAVGPAAEVTRLRAPFTPILADVLTRNRALLRLQIGVLFAPELSAVDPAAARAALAAADVLCSFESYHLLGRDQGLSSEDARAAMATALVALFAGTGTRDPQT
jgi:TetR/AcrR family transcriptional regulator of autoinduction and epiphytic fitness